MEGGGCEGLGSFSIASLPSLGHVLGSVRQARKMIEWRDDSVLNGGGWGRGEEGGTWNCWQAPVEGCSTGGYWHLKDMFSGVFSNRCSLTLGVKTLTLCNEHTFYI